jgi:3-oxoacyl-[acyl-carrier protein] reductase
MRFSNKVAIVTGGGRGIGAGYSKALADEGANVVVADLIEENAQRVADEITAGGGTAVAVQVDVAEAKSALDMAAAAIDAFGGIDHLVNNAGFMHSMKNEPLITCDLDYYRRVIDVNLNGALHCTRAVYQSMAERGGGSIVNQSSTAAWMNAGYYCLSKAANNSLTACLAAELGPMNIRINAIAPGPTDTEALHSVTPPEILGALTAQMAIKRLGTPQDLAGTVLFLLSDECPWLTGQIIPVDGGGTVRL